jgi:NAD-dependent deacetylase
MESGEVPRCPHCGAVLRPDVVLFGEQLPWQAWEEAQTMARQSDLMLIAGSSLAVMPVARLPVEAANHGAAVIIVNQTPTYMDARADVVLQGDVADILPIIAEEVLSP